MKLVRRGAVLKIGGQMIDHQRIVFLNGKFVPEAEASLPIFDRGLLFADAVYEGFGILDGQIVDFIIICNDWNNHWQKSASRSYSQPTACFTI